MCEIQPFVKWVGGKRQLLPVIEKHLPKSYRDYYEPFVGGGAVFLHLRPRHACINDINRPLMHAYAVIRENPERILELLNGMDYTLQWEGASFYYDIRERYNQSVLDSHYDAFLAAAFIFLNKHGFNGLFRVNRQGRFNVPYNYSIRPSCDEENIRNLSGLLNRLQLRMTSLDFEESVQDARTGDFVFFDSPYAPLTATSFTSYTAMGFDEDSHIRLARLYRTLSARGVFCLLTNHNTPFIQELYEGFHQDVVPARRSINRDGNHRTGEEILITNY